MIGPVWDDMMKSHRGYFRQINRCNFFTRYPQPLDVLANYLAGAQIALMYWWLEKHQPHTPETVAQAFHRLQRAAIRDAFGLKDDE